MEHKVISYCIVNPMDGHLDILGSFGIIALSTLHSTLLVIFFFFTLDSSKLCQLNYSKLMTIKTFLNIALCFVD